MRNRFSRLLTGSLGCLTLTGGLFALSSCGIDEGTSLEDLGESRQELLSIANCPPGYQVVQGTAGNDVINVSVSPNPYNVNPALPICIMGLGGNDTITSGSAADVIGGGSGNDIIRGGGGDDQIWAETGDDTVFGDDGNDYINGDHGVDTINGGDGNDRIVDGRGNNVIHGDAGIDWITGGAENDTIFGDDGNDTVDGGAGSNILWGGTGNDVLQVPGSLGPNTLHGDDGDDSLRGAAGVDTMEGGNGNDNFTGAAGNDVIWGDFINNATATTGTTADTIRGGDGNDDLHGGPGNDILFGDNGNDTLAGDDGDDRLNGGANGTKTITGGSGNDLEKSNGTGTATGDANNDAIAQSAAPNGGDGTDACSGGTTNACELNEPQAFCTGSGQCPSGQRCATEVNICIYCQSDSECGTGRTCVPTVGCTTKEVVCTDGLDNDADGATDCADSDCFQDASCQQGVTQLGNGGVWHACITNKSNEVKCWGRGHCSQLGYFVTPATPYSTSAQPIIFTLATTPLAVRGGNAHSCALLTDGTVQCWGNNTQGQLGGGTITKTCSSTGVTTVTGLTGVTQLSSGGNYSCAVVGGGVQCWGENNHGQLGNGTTTNSATPVAVQGLSGTVIEVKTGSQNACALLSNGGVQCWGRNNWGQLGDGTTTSSSTAVTFGMGTVAQIAVSGEFTCARLAGGRVFCSGVNYAGQLGQGTTDNVPHPTPTLVGNITDAADLALGWYHACIVRAAGQGMKCWGRNNFGQVGNGTTSEQVTTPVLLGIYNASNVAAGMEYTCVRRFDGTLGCWGNNQFGQLGNGTTTPSSSQVTVPNVP
jgi:alpha-tubulin suppressor-like RCC1 family protein